MEHNLSTKEYEELLTQQNGCCAICKERKLYYHVDYNKGKVRGLLCLDCDRGISFFNNSFELVNNALGYLVFHEE